MASIKPAAVAGQFYPEDANECLQAIIQYLDQGIQVNLLPKAIIAPHAGYQYSGPIAGSAYSILKDHGGKIRKVVLLGPAHRVPLIGCALPSHDYFQTPLGNVKLDRQAIDALAVDHHLQIYDEAFAEEHCLEVQLPFLQHLLDDFELIPMLVGASDPVIVSKLLADVWHGNETLIVISSDLSHYLDYTVAWETDLATTMAIEAMQVEKVGDHAACGRHAIRGLLHFARSIGMSIRPIDVRNSGDTFGNRERVVGYGAYHIYDDNEAEGLYNHTQKSMLIEIAKQSIIFGLQNKRPGNVPIEKLPFNPAIKRATFVTLEQEGQLRGCIGSLQATTDIATDVVNNAYKAAFQDPRFPPLKQEELAKTALHISVLTEPQAMTFNSEEELIDQLRRGIDGLIIRDQDKQAVYLPMVWRHFHDPKEFLKQLKLKAGMNDDHWSESFTAARFTSDIIG